MQEPFRQMTPSERLPHEYLDVDWAMFGELCRALALKVARDYEPEVVVGITRAGVIPAGVVACVLGVDFYSLEISRKEGDEMVRDRPAIFSDVPPQVEGRRVLIVDEVTTTGDTLRLALAAVRGAHPAEVRTATSFAKTGGYEPDYAALTMDATVVFPWDLKVFDGDELVVNPRYRDLFEEQ